MSSKRTNIGILFLLICCANAMVVPPSTNNSYQSLSSSSSSPSSTALFYRSKHNIARQNTNLFFRDDTDPAVEVKDLSVTSNRPKTQKKPSDFQSRMKRLVIQQRSASSGSSSPSPSNTSQTHPSRKSWRPENVKMAVSLEEFSKVIEEGREENKLIVVRFFATWCKTCHSLRPSYDKLVSANPHAIFLDVPVTDTNANLHQGLGVPSVPFSHIYHPEQGLVEETKLSRKSLPEFGELIEKYSV